MLTLAVYFRLSRRNDPGGFAHTATKFERSMGLTPSMDRTGVVSQPTRSCPREAVMARTTGFFVVVILLLGLAPGAVASGPTSVDPSTLTPPPNPNFTWSCTATPQRIICTGVEAIGAVDAEIDPAFSCDGVPILDTFTQVVTSVRTHDAAGRVIRNHLVGTFDEIWRLQGTTGPLLTTRGRWTETIAYAEPGRLESRTITDTGTTLAVSAPGIGVIFQGTGRVRMNWDGSEILAISGPQAFVEDFDGAIAAACAAFAA
jgi:hypothetical protein